jgi:hypothetical protein
MPSAPRTYGKAVHDTTGWWGTFPIDFPMEVGDLVQLDNDGRLIRYGSVLDWPGWREALPRETRAVTSQTTYSLHAGKTVAASASAGATSTLGVGAEGAIQVSFSKAGGFVIDFVGVNYHRFKDVSVALKWVRGAAKSGEWDNKHVLITEVAEANPATVLMSSKENSSVVLSANASLPKNISSLNLSDPKFNFSVSTWDEGVYHQVSTRAFPLYHCIRVRRKWWFFGKDAELQGAAPVNLEEMFIDSPFEDDDV